MSQVPLRKSLSMPIGQPRLRRRRSLQDDLFARTQSFPKRRLERHSSQGMGGGGGGGGGGALPSVEVALLERIQVEFVKAVLPANKMASTRYVMRVANQALNQSWEMSRTFREFYELKEAIVRALDHGHFCPSNCPWLYMYVTHHFPRRHVFRSRSPAVISNRLCELQNFMSTVLGTWKESRSLDCVVSTSRLPRLLYDFLFQGMVVDLADLNNSALATERASFGRGSLGGSFVETGAGCSDEECSICHLPLVTPDASFAIAPASSKEKNRTASNGSVDTAETVDTSENEISASVMASLTTLACGHCFHDECILRKLNESLTCPRCEADRPERMDGISE